MKSYFDIIERILNEGEPKQATRYNSDGVAEPVENGTIGLSQVYWEHDMAKGFPLLTCRKMPTHSMFVELEGFINAKQSKQWYKDNKCKFWNWWANPKLVQKILIAEKMRYKLSANILPIIEEVDDNIRKKELQEELDDLGPIYGVQWRHFGKEKNCLDGYEGYDQLASIVNSLTNNPYDRRMVCSAWNPNDLGEMALPPCHLLWNVCVYGNTLNLHWHQRSCDTLRGIPNNIASYATLLLILAKNSGLKPGKLSAMFMDCHLYDNDIEHASKLLELPIYNLPTLEITSNGIWDWTHKHTKLLNYKHGPSIEFNKITV